MKNKDLRHELLLVIIFMVTAVTMCSRYTINFDEFYSVQWCRYGWRDYAHEVIHDTSPFLYYFMLKILMDLTGGSLFCARLFSLAALFVLLLVGITFIKKSFGKKAMLFYCFILYLNPFMLQKATEIRMYLWASAFTVLGGVMCYKVLESPVRKNWLLFVCAGLASAFTHYFALLSMIPLYLGLGAYFIWKRNRKQIINWVVCCAVTVAAYLPWLFVAIAQIEESNGNWIDYPDSKLGPLRELFYSEIPGSEHVYLLVMGGFTLLALVCFVRNRTLENYWVLVCGSALWLIVFFCVVCAILVKPVMLSRYLIMPVCLLFLGTSSMARHLNKYILIVLCLFFTVVSGIRYGNILQVQAKDETVRMLDFAKDNIRDGDSIVFICDDFYLHNCIEYYIPQAVRFYAGKFDVEEFREETEGEDFWFFDVDDYMDEDALREAGYEVESLGEYEFTYIDFVIYKVKA